MKRHTQSLVAAALLGAIACEGTIERPITAAVSVAGSPGTVTDLAVASVTQNSATLSFTEVDDGTGLPAKYDVRYAPTPIAWGSAPSVTQGTCATPLQGTAIGAHRTCSVLGLSPATAYDFQLVAYRGTLNLDAVFGGLSNVASGTTSTTSSTWPNEPAGFTLVSDYGFNEPLPSGTGVSLSDGWFINNTHGYATQESDPGAPFSRPNVGRWRYPVGFVSGEAPATMYRGLNVPRTEMYFAYWWKAGTPWQGHPSNVNKISFVMAQRSPGDNFIVQMYGPPGGPYVLMLQLEFPTSNGHLANSGGDNPGTRNVFGNVSGGNYVVTPGQWYRVEVYFKMSTTTTSQDGIIRWWVNGTPVGDYTTVNFNAGNPYVEFQLSPTWGGTGGAKSEEDFYWFDHVRLSAP